MCNVYVLCTRIYTYLCAQFKKVRLSELIGAKTLDGNPFPKKVTDFYVTSRGKLRQSNPLGM